MKTGIAALSEGKISRTFFVVTSSISRKEWVLISERSALTISKVRFIFIISIVFAFLFVLNDGLLSQSLAEIYKSGKVRFVPEMTITDEAMGGKDFFGSLLAVALDDKGNLYVCDYQANNLKKFDSAGKYLGTIGKAGQGPGDFNGPVSLEFSKGRLYVREGMNSRVSILNPDGSFIKSVPIDFKKESWQVMRALPDGRFVVQKEIAHMETLAAHQNAAQDAPQDFYLELYSFDLGFIKTIYHRQVRRNKYVTEQHYANVPIPYAPYVYWDITPDGKIVVGYSEKYEIEVYDPDKGKISSFSHAYTPVEVTVPDKDSFFRGITVTTITDGGERSVKRGAPDYMVKNIEFPKVFPPFHDLKVDSQGNIWITPWTSQAQKTGAVFDAYGPDGKFLNRVQVENNEKIQLRPYWLPNGFWCIRVNADGEDRIVKYRITGLN